MKSKQEMRGIESDVFLYIGTKTHLQAKHKNCMIRKKVLFSTKWFLMEKQQNVFQITLLDTVA